MFLRHFVAQHPHGPRLRTRVGRRATAIQPSHANKVWYYATLRQAVLTRMRTAGVDLLEALRPHWPRPANDASNASPARDAKPPIIRHEVARARARATKGGGAIATHIATSFARKNLGAVDDRLAKSIQRSVGVDIRARLLEEGPIVHEMQRAQRENVELITSIPEQYFDDLEAALAEGWEKGESWEAMVDEVQRIGGVAERRAAFIARDQTNKANAAFNRARQTNLGIKRAEWQTAGDGLVRETHAAMDGKIFEWDDPPLVGDDYLLPGEDYNCRCTGAPVIDLEDVPGEEPDLADVDEDDLDFDEALFAA